MKAPTRAISSELLPVVIAAGLLVAAGPILRHSYLLFHSLTEIGAATISFATFLFAWNTRRFQGTFLIAMGTGALFVGLFETLHTLAFPGMAVFRGYDSNLSPQLWLGARVLEAGSVALGLALLSRPPRPWLWLGGFAAAFAAMATVVFAGYVPLAVIPEGGLTPFKIGMEWALVATFVACAAQLVRVRRRFSERVFRYLVGNVLAMAGADFCFTLYSRPTDTANFLGHVLVICGVYWEFKAVLQTGLTDPGEAQFRDLVLAREELREADRRKTEFLAMLSHELRNPLAPVRNSLYVLERAAPGGEQALRALSVLDRQVQHLARLVDDLLDVTRVTQGKIRLQRATVELAELVRKTAEDHRETFTHAGIELAVEVPRGPLYVDADATRLAQVIGNLLGNAEKFCVRGGHVVLSLQEEAGGRAALRVRDDGAGIPPDVISRLFQPFVQAEKTLDRSRGGLGLGLALVKGLVELHGGSVSARSEGLGKGAEISVVLPVVAPPAAAQRAEAPSAAPKPPSRKVLLIEDNVDAAESLKEVLELWGHSVEIAFDGTVGMQRAHAFSPDIVLCDIGLPGMDGYEVARALRAETGFASSILVALSGYAQSDDIERSKRAGFDRHIAKPLDLEALEELLSAKVAKA